VKIDELDRLIDELEASVARLRQIRESLAILQELELVEESVGLSQVVYRILGDMKKKLASKEG